MDGREEEGVDLPADFGTEGEKRAPWWFFRELVLVGLPSGYRILERSTTEWI